MNLADVTPEQLARALFDEIVEREPGGGRGYYIYGVESDEPGEGNEFLTALCLDGRDNLIEIVEGALIRLQGAKPKKVKP